MRHIVIDAARVGDADAREGEALLILEVVHFLGAAVREDVIAPVQEIGLEQAGHVVRVHGAVSHSTRRRDDFHQRLEPQEPARAIANNVHIEIAAPRFIRDGGRGFVRPHGASGGIPGNVNRHGGHEALAGVFRAVATSSSKRRGFTRPFN